MQLRLELQLGFFSSSKNNCNSIIYKENIITIITHAIISLFSLDLYLAMQCILEFRVSRKHESSSQQNKHNWPINSQIHFKKKHGNTHTRFWYCSTLATDNRGNNLIHRNGEWLSLAWFIEISRSPPNRKEEYHW